MAAQSPILAGTTLESLKPIPSISLSPHFHLVDQDARLGRPGVSKPPNALPQAPLGILDRFQGDFRGIGLNTIFRPNSGQTKFPNLPPSDNVLELNLTTETLSFSAPLGDVPNRGLNLQPDITLNGVSYVQSVNDVTNTKTGRGDKPPSNIHFEPGLWMHVPATTVDPILPETLARMASIPHGTTINAQGLAPTTTTSGPPPFGDKQFPHPDITPFQTKNPTSKIPFPSQIAANKNTPRLPQDLTSFIAAGTITQAILDNPQLVLLNAIQGQKIKSTTTFTISTGPVGNIKGGGTANIDFLDGSNTALIQAGPNASAVNVTATFWVETVEYTISVPACTKGVTPLSALTINVPGAANAAAPAGPTFQITDPGSAGNPELKTVTSNTAAPTVTRNTAAQTITATATQIQYAQTVFLNFATLTWPHVSVATLLPSRYIVLPASVLH